MALSVRAHVVEEMKGLDGLELSTGLVLYGLLCSVWVVSMEGGAVEGEIGEDDEVHVEMRYADFG
jgi:hypothetical protein